jgi:hypothetical protein
LRTGQTGERRSPRSSGSRSATFAGTPLISLKKQKKDKEISEDDLFKLQDDAQTETDTYVAQIDEITASKENEVMDV